MRKLQESLRKSSTVFVRHEWTRMNARYLANEIAEE